MIEIVDVVNDIVAVDSVETGSKTMAEGRRIEDVETGGLGSCRRQQQPYHVFLLVDLSRIVLAECDTEPAETLIDYIFIIEQT